MDKIDLKKQFAGLYNPPAKEVTLIDVLAMNFIMIDGRGTPESDAYQQAIEALYSVAYTIKFSKKKADGTDYAVMPLEGLWWADDMSVFDPQKADRNQWQWTMMIMQPDFITEADFNTARESSSAKKGNPAISLVRFRSLKEGKAVQIMHIGPFSTEGPNVRRVHEKISEIGGRLSGKHHEIYLSDFRRVDPAKMKTILRQPYSM
jgi:hypothetical protein